jgi:hypothetical protein
MILAGERPGEFHQPRISQGALDNKSVLTLQVSSLEFLGHSREQIYLVTNDVSVPVDDLPIQRVLLSSSTRGSLNSFLDALKRLGQVPEQLIVLYSDYIPNIEDLEALGSMSAESRILAERPLRFDSRRTRIFSKSNSIVSIEPPKDAHLLPWLVFGGAISLTIREIKLLIESTSHHSEIDLLIALGRVVQPGTLRAVNPMPQRLPVKQSQDSLVASRLLGGSLANLHKQVLVRKSAKAEDGQKLIREARWLKENHVMFPDRFPKVFDVKESGDTTTLDMDFVEKQSFRNLVLSGAWGFDQASTAIKSVLDFMFENFYSRDSQSDPNTWIISRHLDRFHLRNRPNLYNSPVLKGALSASSFVINGKEFPAPWKILDLIASSQEIIRKLSPPLLTEIHGDLHLQNILCEDTDPGGGFTLVDPRGEIDGGDPMYDIGKLFHSTNGKYDFFHSGLFHIRSEDSGQQPGIFVAEYGILAEAKSALYSRLDGFVRDELEKLAEYNSNMMKDWEFRADFAEAINFLTLSPFHSKGNHEESLAVALFLRGVELLSRWSDRYSVEARLR